MTTMKKNLKALSVLLLGTAILAAGCGAKSAGNESSGAGTNTPASNASGNAGGSAAKSWSKKPDMAIDTSKTYQAVVTTTDGEFTIDLFAKDAPETVNSFVFLARQNFFDGIVFHRIIQDFMIQTGDPTGTGAGGPGYTIPDELDNGHAYKKGVVAMANTGQADTGGSQFFIGTGPSVEGLSQLPNYTIFGEISGGMDIVDKIAATPVEGNAQGESSKPTRTVSIQSVEIKES
ncbi:Peptidyl-prolyl cis-trans isomerase (rotamase)-cyclophilin family [Paenibacillus sp. RU4T]|nr:Peptidyl-prolyl cis-trans isomerase (rotamase)-cyclophilin family [Paenibacillus sp. RU4X]SIQ64717.1 Peptidyl-prolyl cis-trans isomerase (rotamase)-cyclophilin family [Paenibacillus sp. RU4T]